MEMEIKAPDELLEHLHRENKPTGYLVEPSKKLLPILVFEEVSNSLASLEVQHLEFQRLQNFFFLLDYNCKEQK